MTPHHVTEAICEAGGAWSLTLPAAAAEKVLSDLRRRRATFAAAHGQAEVIIVGIGTAPPSACVLSAAEARRALGRMSAGQGGAELGGAWVGSIRAGRPPTGDGRPTIQS